MLKLNETIWPDDANDEKLWPNHEFSDHVFGQIALNEGMLRAYRQFDAAFLKLALGLRAQEYQFPSFIKAEQLGKLGDLRSFPQHAAFPQVLCCDEHNYRLFRNAEAVSRNDSINVTGMNPPKAILTPAACYHFYIHFQNSAFTRSQVLTTKIHAIGMRANIYRSNAN